MNQHRLWGGRRWTKWLVALLAAFAARTVPAAASSVDTRATYHTVEATSEFWSYGRLRCAAKALPAEHFHTVSPYSPYSSATTVIVCGQELRMVVTRSVTALGTSGTSPPYNLRVKEKFELFHNNVKCQGFEETRDLPVPWSGWSWDVDLEGCGSNQVRGRIHYTEYITAP